MHILKHSILLLPIIILTGCGGSDSTKEPIKVEEPQEQNQTIQNHETNSSFTETNSTTEVVETNSSTAVVETNSTQESNVTAPKESNSTQSEDEYEDIYLSENGYYDTEGHYHSNDEISTPVSKSFSDKTFYIVDTNESDSGQIRRIIFTPDMSKFSIQHIVGEGDSEKWDWNITSYTNTSFYIEDEDGNSTFLVTKKTDDYLEMTEYSNDFEENTTNTYKELFYFTQEKARAYIDSLNNGTALFAGKTLYVTDEVANSGKLLRISYNQTMQEERTKDMVNGGETVDDSIFVEGLDIFSNNNIQKHIKLGEITDEYIKATYNREEIRFYFEEAKAKAHAGL